MLWSINVKHLTLKCCGIKYKEDKEREKLRAENFLNIFYSVQLFMSVDPSNILTNNRTLKISWKHAELRNSPDDLFGFCRLIFCQYFIFNLR